MFRVEKLDYLSQISKSGEMSPALLALLKPVEGTDISYDVETAQRVVKDVNGYPYFIQKYGAALWNAARERGNTTCINEALYDEVFLDIQDDLDEEFYEPRVEELAPAEQGIVRLAGSLSKESFKLSELIKKAFIEMNKSERAVQSSIAKLVSEGVIYRIRQGEYAYTAPMFGDFLRRKYPI
jgi:hypothetical protein